MNPAMILAYTCSRPYYKLMADAVDDPSAIMNWVLCPYSITGIGLQGVGFFIILTVAVGMKNWSESFVVPAVWLALSTGVLVTMIPAPVINRLFGVLVAGVALLFIGFIFYFR